MKPRTLLILLAVVLALSAFIFFYERKLPSSEERTKLGKQVFSFEKDDVTAVAIDSSKGPVRLERVGGAALLAAEKKAKKGGVVPEPSAEWRLTGPLAARADTFAVDHLLEALGALEKTRTLDKVDAKAVGLDQPRATVRLTTKSGEKVLKLGAEVPPGGTLIAGVDHEKGAYAVSDSILPELEKAPGDWRDRLIFRADREAVQRITLTGAPDGTVILARRPEGFRIESPALQASDWADRDLVEGLFADLTGLTAERFLDGSQDLKELGLDPPRGTVEVALAGAAPAASPIRIDLGGPVTGGATPAGQPSGERSYARAGGALFEVRTRLGESARRPAADWRSLKLSKLEVHQVDSATIQGGQGDGAPVHLTRAGTDWKRDATVISFLPVSDLLLAVTSAKAEHLLSPREAQAQGMGAWKPALTVELRGKEGGKDAGTETITLYPPAAGGVPARVSGRDTVLVLPGDTLQKVQDRLKDVRTARGTGK
jgi:Domain of unknown function (DUF4340)